MPDLPSSSSFIPKRTMGNSLRQKRTRNFFLLSVVSYACLIAAPTASAAVYVYQLYTERQFEQVVQKLETAIGGFSEAEMSRVLEFDRRLRLASGLVDNHVSLVKAIDILEKNTAANVGFSSLNFARKSDGSLSAKAEIVATNFDAALFQRTAYLSNTTDINESTLDGIAFVPPSDVGLGERVTMSGEFDFTADAIRFTANRETTTAETTASPAEDTSEDSEATEASTDTAISEDVL
jgi:hypothetical protein